MERQVIYRANGSEHSITMSIGGELTQKFSVEGMTPDQRSETMALAIQWLKAPKFKTPAHTTVRRKARILDDIRLTERVANYASVVTEFQQAKIEKRRKAQAEARMAKTNVDAKKED